MYSLVILCCENYGLANLSHCVVSGFETEKAAYEYAAGKLVESGLVTFVDGVYSIEDDDETYHTAEDVVEAWACTLESSEYYHIVPQQIDARVTRSAESQSGASSPPGGAAVDLNLKEFEKELKGLINRHSLENRVDMPDFILSTLLCNMICALETPLKENLDWHGCDSVCHPKKRFDA